jgi:hypothetical protein
MFRCSYSDISQNSISWVISIIKICWDVDYGCAVYSTLAGYGWLAVCSMFWQIIADPSAGILSVFHMYYVSHVHSYCWHMSNNTHTCDINWDRMRLICFPLPLQLMHTCLVPAHDNTIAILPAFQKSNPSCLLPVAKLKGNDFNPEMACLDFLLHGISR